MDEQQALLSAIAPVIVLLGTGLIAVFATRRAGLSPIVGYLLLGMLLRTVDEDLVSGGTVAVLAELGVVFLLFDIGLHFSVSHVREQAKDIFGLGALQVLFGTVGLGSIAMVSGFEPVQALMIGSTLALSSTAVVVRVIVERHQQNCPVGVTATAVLVFQDVAAIFILIVLNAAGSSTPLVPAIGVAMAKAVAAFAAAVILARIVVRPLFDLLARTRNEEVFTATALLVALAAGWATGTAGLSLTLGAFLGGMVIAETRYRPLIQAEIRPFRGLLLGFFFISVGASLDIDVLASSWYWVIGTAVLLVVAKSALNAAASLVFRWSLAGSTQLGFLLGQGSEFGFVVLSLPAVHALLGTRVCAILISAIALTLAITPNVAAIGRLLARHLRRSDASNHELTERGRAAPVFIAGMGPRGRTVADALNSFSISYGAIEGDPTRLGLAAADGYEVEFGDINDARLWQSLAMTGRRMLVLTEPVFEVSRDLTPLARQYFPYAIRVAAVDDADGGAKFASIGLKTVVDHDRSGVALAAGVLAMLDIEDDAINEWTERRH